MSLSFCAGALKSAWRASKETISSALYIPQLAGARVNSPSVRDGQTKRTA